MYFQKWKSSGIVTALLAGLYIPVAFSGPMGETPVASGYFVTLEGGAAWQSGDKSQIIFLAPDIEEAYIVDRTHNAIVQGDFFFWDYAGIKSDFSRTAWIGTGSNRICKACWHNLG